MRRIARLGIVIASIVLVTAAAAAAGQAHRRRPPAPPPHARQGAVVFVGGYFYDPFFGPYPWWRRGAYPHPYYPVYDSRAVVRVIATPKDAAVYVDGFYAGTVHDFNDWFQGLPLPPGGHDIVLFLDGYRTVRDRLYLTPGSTISLRRTMERLPMGEDSVPPAMAPPLPPPPDGSFTPPHTPRPLFPLEPPQGLPAGAYGTLALRIEPAEAEVLIDGNRWVSSDGRTFVIQVTAGRHRIEISRTGYKKYAADFEVRDDATTRLNVSLTPETAP
jgi:hypothetical protein